MIGDSSGGVGVWVTVGVISMAGGVAGAVWRRRAEVSVMWAV